MDTGSTGPTGPIGYTGYIGYTGCTGQTGPTGPYASLTGMTGINIVLNSNIYEVKLNTVGTDISYNIFPKSYYNITIDKYGRSALTFNNNVYLNNITSTGTCISCNFIDSFGEKYTYYDFKSNDNSKSTSSFTCLSGGIVSLLMVGGGGGGASGIGSSCAGAGEVLFIDNYYLNTGNYDIEIGGGGGGIGLNSDNSGNFTYISNSSGILFGSAGGAGGVLVDNSGANGYYGTNPQNPTLSRGTSSGSGSGSGSVDTGKGTPVTYLSGNTPYVNTFPTIWSYANNGGQGLINGGGGGGGAGGPGGSVINDTSYGVPGIGLYINFYKNVSGQPGSIAGGSGYSEADVTEYGAGASKATISFPATPGSGSGGGSSHINNEQGGSGRLIIRY